MEEHGWTPIESLDGLWVVGIYALRHKPSGRVLICGSTNTYKRLWDDIRSLKHGRHYNPDLQRDLLADGPAAFDFWVVQRVGVPALLKLLKAHHVAEVAKLGLDTYNVKPAIPKEAKGRRKPKLVEPPPLPSFTPPKTTNRDRLSKSLLRGLPSVERDRDRRVDELLNRVSKVIGQYNLERP